MAGTSAWPGGCPVMFLPTLCSTRSNKDVSSQVGPVRGEEKAYLNALLSLSEPSHCRGGGQEGKAFNLSVLSLSKPQGSSQREGRKKADMLMSLLCDVITLGAFSPLLELLPIPPAGETKGPDNPSPDECLDERSPRKSRVMPRKAVTNHLCLPKCHE